MSAVKAPLAMVACAFVLAASLIAPGYAHAQEGIVVSGADSYAVEGSVPVLSVVGNAGDAFYVEVVSHGETIVSHLQQTVESSEEAGIVDLSIASYESAYTVRAYADREQTKLLYEGTTYPVYATFDGSAKQLVALRTLSSTETRTFTPQETMYVNGVTYRLARTSSGEAKVASSNGSLEYAYESYDVQGSVDGSITYVDADSGETLSTQVIAGIQAGGTRVVAVPTAITASDGSVYRTIFFANAVSASNPGQRDFVISCRKIASAGELVAGYYVATINLVDADTKALLASDYVTVTGTYAYTAPDAMYLQTEDGTLAYGLSGADAATLSKLTGNVLFLDAAVDGVTSGSATYTLYYSKQQASSGSAEVTFNIVDASKRVGDATRMLGVETATAYKGGASVEPPSTYTASDGTTYVIAGNASMYAYSYDSGENPVVDVYYVPEGYSVPADYEVTVNYINVLDGSVIASSTYASSASDAGDLEITTDATFTRDGTEWIRLDGQEGAISHNFYSSFRAYTVYYRSANDIASSGVVVSHLRVSYSDATGGTPASVASATASADDAGQLSDSSTYNVLSDGSGALIENNDGTDSEGERIEENDSPLASWDDPDSGFSLSKLAQFAPFGVGFGIGLAAIVVVLFLLMRQRRKGHDDDDDGDGPSGGSPALATEAMA